MCTSGQGFGFPLGKIAQVYGKSWRNHSKSVEQHIISRCIAHCMPFKFIHC